MQERTVFAGADFGATGGGGGGEGDLILPLK